MKTNLISALLITFSVFFLYSCSSDPVSPPGGRALTFSGQIGNWPGQPHIVRARVYGNLLQFSDVGADTVDANGQMSMNILNPPANVLRSIRQVTQYNSGFTISDTNALAAYLGFLEVYNLSNTRTGSADLRNFTNDSTVAVGSFTVEYFYVDRNTNISGTNISINGSDTVVTTVNLQFVTGWNAYNIRAAELRPYYVSLNVTNGESSGASWYYYPVPPDDSQEIFHPWRRQQ
jgi:hypothetical protein